MRILLLICTFLFSWMSFFQTALADNAVSLDNLTPKELNIQNWPKAGANRQNWFLDELGSTFSGFWFTANTTGEVGARNLIFRIARDAKNLFILLGVVYLFVGVFTLIGGNPSPESRAKWGRQILWTAIGIVVMQISYSFVSTVFNKNIWGGLALDLLEKILYPLIKVLKYLAATLFLAMMFYAVYTLVTGGGEEEASKKGKSTLVSAIIGFLLIQVPEPLIKAIYGSASCKNIIFGICQAEITNPNLGSATKLMVNFVNYINGFIALFCVLMIIYAGWLTFTAGGNEENFKKSKNIILYAGIGILIVIVSYMLLNFLLLQG